MEQAEVIRQRDLLLNRLTWIDNRRALVSSIIGAALDHHDRILRADDPRSLGTSVRRFAATLTS